MNLLSPLLNLSALARATGHKPTTLYNRLHKVGRHSPLSVSEMATLEQAIKADLFHNGLNQYQELLDYNDQLQAKLRAISGIVELK